MASDEERALEHQLEVQLHEQKESLAALQDALASDASNPELLEVHEELVQAIKDAEEGLLHLKRSRLLREADSVLRGHDSNPAEDVKAEPLYATDVEPEPLEDHSFVVGSKCRFRYTDGRWYDGEIVGLDGSNSAKISFLTPTTENMLSSSCAGVDIPLTSLRSYVPTIWNQSMAGSSIWALSSRNDIWRHAELESWDDALQVAQVVFKGDGSSQKLGPEDIALSEYAQINDEEESDSSLEQSDSSDYEEDDLQGLGFLESSIQQKGIQTETAIFAKWENHTRGIASKMMANMGYREGMGLGASGQGMLNPIPVKVLPAKQSLDHALESQKENNTNDENNGKKRSRGGKRKREKKFAAASRAAKEEEESRPDVFNLINHHLAMHNRALNDGSVKKQKDKGSADGKKVDRRTIIAYDDEVKDLRVRIEKLEEMVNRNKKEKVVYEAALRKLNETRKALAEAEAAHASASNAVTSREKEKRWLKF
ncbi:hypothetical protein IC575_006952 [Cucumis melo]